MALFVFSTSETTSFEPAWSIVFCLNFCPLSPLTGESFGSVVSFLQKRSGKSVFFCFSFPLAQRSPACLRFLAGDPATGHGLQHTRRRKNRSPGQKRCEDAPGLLRGRPIRKIRRSSDCPREVTACLPPRRREAAIPSDDRIFTCGACGTCTRICRRCDRGQRYCSPSCSRQARRHSVREAGRRYRRTFAGRLGNARRQRAYYCRSRLREKNLMHQGSEPRAVSPSMARDVSERTVPCTPGVEQPLAKPQHRQLRLARCGFCGRLLDQAPRKEGGP